jgi:hypothetical protein
LTTALTSAALRQRNLEWAMALLEQDGYNDRTGRLISLLPPDVCVAELRNYLMTAGGRPLAADSPLIRFMRYWPHHWDGVASRLWVDFLLGQAQLEEEGRATAMLRYQMRQLAKQCAPEVTGYAAEVLTSLEFSDPWRQACKAFLRTLIFRSEMLKAIR